MLSVAMLVLVSRKELGGAGGVIDGVLSVGCVGAGVIVGGFVSCVDGDRTLEGCGMDGDRALESCGMVVSGVPLGGVRFVDCFLEKRLQKTSSDLKKISIRLSLRSPQARFLLLKSCDMQVWQFLSSLVPPPVIRPFLVRFDDAIDTTIDEHVLGVPAAKERC